MDKDDILNRVHAVQQMVKQGAIKREDAAKWFNTVVNPPVGPIGAPIHIKSGHLQDIYKQYDGGRSERLRMIAMRLRIQDGAVHPFEFIETHEAADRVLVFVVQNGQPVTIEDDKVLFPTDALITQLRLLAE